MRSNKAYFVLQGKMASNYFILRCKTKKGSFTLTDLSFDSTVEDLKLSLAKLTAINPSAMKFLGGYPPKPLASENDSLKLTDLNIHSGDTLIMEIKKDVPGNAPEEAALGAQGNGIGAALGAQGNGIGAALGAQENDFKDVVMNQPAIMMRHVVPSNNSCLFTSIYFILTNGAGNEETSDLRGIIASVVKNNPDKYNDAFLGKPNEEYCAWIRDPNHWGGAIELSILSEHFEIEIVAIDILGLTAHCFGETNDYRNRIFLIYDGIHYDPLVLEYEDNTQTIFPTSDQRPMDMAMELAREARSSRQFTDVANFSLSCKSCKLQVKGNVEAHEHALVTGHCEFGEVIKTGPD
ncbi:ubiquitin thioesterase OTU1 [Nephila pilipes]|uniref:Ubiquitin thioesterase OTU n=1 Tax=Nephila pilipes TaxID=299642 RepID=A0A8X6TEX0_NEPPI|nr:ubiquitin thioesterase OTU1 [Nephila pilipes]